MFSTEALYQSLPFILPFLLTVMGWTQALTRLLMSRKFGFIFPVSIIWLCYPGSQAVF